MKLFDKDPKGEINNCYFRKKINKNTSQISESDKRNIKNDYKLSTKEITNLISQNSKVSKKEIYNYCLKLKNEK